VSSSPIPPIGGSPAPAAPDSGRAAAALHPREFVAQQFAAFLRENYRSEYQVARAFYVDERTAGYWMAGRHCPNGVVICLAFGLHPQSAARHLQLVVSNPQPLDRPALRISADERRMA
jgi:hypothetical protein